MCGLGATSVCRARQEWQTNCAGEGEVTTGAPLGREVPGSCAGVYIALGLWKGRREGRPTQYSARLPPSLPRAALRSTRPVCLSVPPSACFCCFMIVLFLFSSLFRGAAGREPASQPATHHHTPPQGKPGGLGLRVEGVASHVTAPHTHVAHVLPGLHLNTGLVLMLHRRRRRHRGSRLLPGEGGRRRMARATYSGRDS